MAATIRYADEAGSNTAPYETWAKAATNAQTIIDLAGAGDTNYYRNTFTLGAQLDFDTNSGTLAGGYIKHIGANAAGVVDGTYAVFDGDSAAANCIRGGTKSYHQFENIECKNATSHGVTGNTTICPYWVFKNVYSHNNGGAGFGQGSTYLRICRYVDCFAENNASYGFGDSYLVTYVNCSAIGNGNYGYLGGTNCSPMYGCIAHDNTTGQVSIGGGAFPHMMENCVIDGWDGAAPAGIGINVAGETVNIIGCRITNCVEGINLTVADFAYYDYCGFYNNTADTDVPAGNILVDGGHNEEPMAAEGYNGGVGGGAGHDFNLIITAELRRTQIKVGEYNA